MAIVEKTGRVDVRLVEGLISIKQNELAYQLIEKCNIESIRSDKQILSLYLNLLCERDLDKAVKI